jgi:hypothetical protein
LGEILGRLAAGGSASLPSQAGALRDVIREFSLHDPDRLSSEGALGFWLDLYNSGALALAAEAAAAGRDSVLRVPGAFRVPFVEVAGETLSLDAVEHAKVRRFGDPRIHSALVCGSVSCPTLRSLPFSGSDLDDVLDHQMRAFLAGGGADFDERSGVVRLSRVFAWYGSDFVRPSRMPTFVPVRRRTLMRALVPWLDGPVRAAATSAETVIEFQSYDWGLRCSVG